MKDCLPTPERNDEGAVAIIVAILLVALLTLAALVIDLGGLYDHDRELQTSADAGALAGAYELVVSGGSHSAATGKTHEYVDKNLAPNSHVVPDNLDDWSPLVTDTSVTVDLRERDIPFFFAPIFGETAGSVVAHAKAEVKFLTGVDDAFPVAINYMNPESFRLRFTPVSGGESEFSFSLTDDDSDGEFVGGENRTPEEPGLYSVTLEAMESDGETVGMSLPDIGLWRVADTSDPDEKLYRVGMEQNGSMITVRAEASPTAFEGTWPDEISAKLGSNNVTLFREGTRFYEGEVAAPTGTSNDGWGTHDLTIQKLSGNQSVARYLALHPDIPLREFAMTSTGTDSFFGGYSAVVGEDVYVGGMVKVRILTFGEKYVMKLGNQAGSGVYSGNWRIADVYKEPNTMDEIGTFPMPDDWTLYHPLEIGGPLKPETGASVGQIKNGLKQRFEGYDPQYTTDQLEGMGQDAAVDTLTTADPYFVIVPIVEFASLHGSSEPYTIAGFSGFYITDHTGAGDIEGVFVHSLGHGEHQDAPPPGGLYVETVVMTE